MWNAIHHSSPQNTAPSLMRSHVASSTAPNRVPPPRCRAIAPSSMSNSVKNQTTHPPRKSLPIGNSVSDPATDAMVPMTVATSGVRPTRSAARATGSVTRAKKAFDRNGNLLISAAPLPRKREVPPHRSLALHRRRRGSWLVGPLSGKQSAGVAQQLRDHLGAADDGDEVRVAAPPRHDVHVQVLGQ